MTKTEIIAHIAEEAQIPKASAVKALESIVNLIISETKKGEKVAIAGLGIFNAKNRPERMGINPMTKEPVKIAASVKPTFRAAKSYKEELKTLLGKKAPAKKQLLLKKLRH